MDGRSTDGTIEILRAFQRGDNRVKLVFEDRKGSPAKARNLGIENASGDFVLFKDADGRLLDKHYLDKIIDPLEDNPNAEVILMRTFPSLEAKTTFEQMCLYREIAPLIGELDYDIAIRRGFLVDNKILWDESLGFGDDHVFFDRVFRQKPRIVKSRWSSSLEQIGLKSLEEFARRASWYGRTLSPFYRKTRRTRSLFLPFVFALSPLRVKRTYYKIRDRGILYYVPFLDLIFGIFCSFGIFVSIFQRSHAP